TLDFGLWTHIDCPFRAELFCQGQARIEKIRRDDFDSAKREQACEHQADGALAGDEDGVAAKQVQPVDRFEDGVHWLEHRALEKGVAGWNFYDTRKDKAHDADVFGIAATGWLEAGGNPGSLVRGALSKGPMPAGVAFQAGNVMMHGDAITD